MFNMSAPHHPAVQLLTLGDPVSLLRMQVMMQTSEVADDAEAHPSSPLNQLKQSLRISDDDGVAKSHKRHLSLAQQVGDRAIAPSLTPCTPPC